MIKKISILICLVIASIYTLNAQQRIDSLILSLDTLEGKPRVGVLNELSSYYSGNEVYEALRYASESLNLSKELNYSKGIQKSLFNLGLAYSQSYDYKNSLDKYRKSLEYLDKEKDHEEMASIYNNIGVIYYLMEDFEKSIEYYNAGNKLLELTGDKKQELTFVTNIAIIFAEKEEYDSAKYYFDKAYQIISNPSFQYKKMKLLVKLNVIEFYIDTKDYNLAFEMITQAINEIDTDTDNTIKSGLYGLLGSLYLEYENYSESEEALNTALKYAQEHGSPQYIMETHKILFELYKKWGKHKLALEEFENYQLIKDSTLTAKKNSQIINLEAKYEWEKQQKEIELLKKEAALKESELARSKLRSVFFACMALLAIIEFIIIHKAYRYKNKSNKELEKLNYFLVDSETKLLELNSMKDNLIHIIGHDLKNPLNSVLGFSYLLANGNFTEQPEKLRKFSKLILKTSKSIIELLDNILYWAKLQQGGYEIKKTNFNVKESFLKTIQAYEGIAESKNINISVDIDDDIFAFGDSFTFEIVIGNLLNNALKFSHNNSEVKFKAINNHKNVIFSVADNGVGIDKKACGDLFNKHIFNTSPGTNNEQGTGFGLKICNQFVELNSGKIWVESEKDKGSTFFFTFPKIKKT